MRVKRLYHFQEKSVTPADGQTMMLDQRFFHGTLKGGFFIGKRYIYMKSNVFLF